MQPIQDSDGYKSLLASVEKDYAKDRTFQAGGKPFHDYRKKMDWAVDRAKHYGEALGLEPADVLDAWENDRNYWYMNYYQDANQPEITAQRVRVFNTVEDLKDSLQAPEFRCPNCKGVSSDAYTCNSGLKVDKKTCDWKSYGLFGTLGKGAFVYVKEKLAGHEIFMPVAWENSDKTEAA